ncbi:MAG: hypothetical protein JSR66_24480 [Proteobacteria bacterium]|nr:hypothetical protein [Pseudomonadota bacterium]
MPVSSGRAKSGAHSVLRTAFMVAAAFLFLNSCGNDRFTYGTPLITFSVNPGPFTAYIAEIDQIVLTRTDNTPVYPLLQPQIVDFTKLADTPEVFGAPAIIEGSYISATITVNYGSSLYQPSGALLFMNVNGKSTQVTPVDTSGKGTAATSVSYTVKFDPNNPLVIKHGVSTPLDFNFDLSASSLVNTTTSPRQVTVRPYMTATTKPNYSKPMRARGVYVTTEVANNNFTINSRSFFDTAGQPVGAIGVQTDGNTVFNINGTIYQGSAGLTALNQLQINSIVEAFGKFGDLNNVKPTFIATQVYAGVAVENVLTVRITGTISSRSGTTLHIKGAELETFNSTTPIGEYVTFQDDLTMTIGPQTVVNVDGHPELKNVTTDYLSVGQQVDMEALAVTDSSGAVVKDAAGNPTWTVAGGLVRLTPTTGWAVQNSAPASGISANLISLGGFDPATLNFTGTNSVPAAYTVSTTGLNTSTLAANPVFRFDGLVAPFGMAPPDFIADSVATPTATDQVLTVEWSGNGTATPFITKDANGLVVNITGGSLGATHTVQTGLLSVPNASTTIDLTSPAVNPVIVADPTLTAQFSVGNPASTASPATGIALFNSYSSFLTQLNTVLNGTNTILKLVAVGKYDTATNTFTAHSINMVQFQ